MDSLLETPKAIQMNAEVPVVPSATKTIRIGFCDMWENFNPEYNFFTLMLQAAGLTQGIEVVGGPASAADSVVIFGPFGNTWLFLPPQQPKVHFTGENTPEIEGIALNLGFQHKDMAGKDYLRFPLWLLEIDWFAADLNRIANPKPIPVERCTRVFGAEIARKKKFCAFIVSNPTNPLRGLAFDWLSEYKHVDSAGNYKNNVGNQLAAGAGGGGGELLKHEYLKDYKFCLAFENASSPGYITEKFLHAKAAGCIPIYWGDPKADRDFSMAGAIDARNVKSKEELIALVRAVDESDSEWLKRYSVPALDSYKEAWAHRPGWSVYRNMSYCGWRQETRRDAYTGPWTDCRSPSCCHMLQSPIPPFSSTMANGPFNPAECNASAKGPRLHLFRYSTGHSYDVKREVPLRRVCSTSL